MRAVLHMFSIYMRMQKSYARMQNQDILTVSDYLLLKQKHEEEKIEKDTESDKKEEKVGAEEPKEECQVTL